MIEKWILPQLTIGTRGFETTVPLIEIVESIFHRVSNSTNQKRQPYQSGTPVFDEELYQDRSVIEHANT